MLLLLYGVFFYSCLILGHRADSRRLVSKMPKMVFAVHITRDMGDDAQTAAASPVAIPVEKKRKKKNGQVSDRQGVGHT